MVQSPKSKHPMPPSVVAKLKKKEGRSIQTSKTISTTIPTLPSVTSTTTEQRLLSSPSSFCATTTQCRRDRRSTTSTSTTELCVNWPSSVETAAVVVSSHRPYELSDPATDANPFHAAVTSQYLFLMEDDKHHRDEDDDDETLRSSFSSTASSFSVSIGSPLGSSGRRRRVMMMSSLAALSSPRRCRGFEALHPPLSVRVKKTLRLPPSSLLPSAAVEVAASDGVVHLSLARKRTRTQRDGDMLPPPQVVVQRRLLSDLIPSLFAHTSTTQLDRMESSSSTSSSFPLWTETISSRSTHVCKLCLLPPPPLPMIHDEDDESEADDELIDNRHSHNNEHHNNRKGMRMPHLLSDRLSSLLESFLPPPSPRAGDTTATEEEGPILSRSQYDPPAPRAHLKEHGRRRHTVALHIASLLHQQQQQQEVGRAKELHRPPPPPPQSAVWDCRLVASDVIFPFGSYDHRPILSLNSPPPPPPRSPSPSPLHAAEEHQVMVQEDTSPSSSSSCPHEPLEVVLLSLLRKDTYGPQLTRLIPSAFRHSGDAMNGSSCSSSGSWRRLDVIQHLFPLLAPPTAPPVCPSASTSTTPTPSTENTTVGGVAEGTLLAAPAQEGPPPQEEEERLAWLFHRQSASLACAELREEGQAQCCVVTDRAAFSAMETVPRLSSSVLPLRTCQIEFVGETLFSSSLSLCCAVSAEGSSPMPSMLPSLLPAESQQIAEFLWVFRLLTDAGL